MRFVVPREILLKPLRAVGGVVERKHLQNFPILLNVLIKVQDHEFSLTTTDQEVELVACGKLEEVAAKNGMITVPIRKLMDICKTLPEGQILSILEENGKVILRAGRSRFTLATLPASEFPSLDDAVGVFQFLISKRRLKSLLEQICFAMAEQDVRYYLNGMLLEIKNGTVYAVAADGHRLAFGRMALNEFIEADTKIMRVIVPRKGILELQRILEDTDEEIRVVVGLNHIRIFSNDIQITSKLLSGRFPDYERIVAVNGDKVFIGHRESLKEAFQRAAALFSDKFRGVQLKLTKGLLKILAVTSEQDEVEEDLEVDYQGADLEIGFNIRYLIDFLNVIPAEKIKFTLSDANNSARVEGIGMGSKGSVYIIMPMKI